jgi:hypothetical protein
LLFGLCLLLAIVLVAWSASRRRSERRVALPFS